MDVEDQGHKGFNYRSEPIGEPRWLDVDQPATPVFEVPPESKMWFRLVGGADKPRHYSFTIHGQTWLATQADYDCRTGVLKWALPQGLWGILRVRNGCN